MQPKASFNIRTQVKIKHTTPVISKVSRCTWVYGYATVIDIAINFVLVAAVISEIMNKGDFLLFIPEQNISQRMISFSTLFGHLLPVYIRLIDENTVVCVVTVVLHFAVEMASFDDVSIRYEVYMFEICWRSVH